MTRTTLELKTDQPPVEFVGDRLSVRFDRFDPAAYGLFLRIKALPESAVEPTEDLTYTVTAPARFAAMLGVVVPPLTASILPFPAYLFDDQQAITLMSLAAKRFAVWADCGQGKTPIGLEWARQVSHLTGGRVLIVTLNEIAPQWLDEARKFYGDSLPLVPLRSRAVMKEWCQYGTIGGDSTPGTIGVTNYEKFNHKTDAEQVVTEIRHLAGLALDESSRLKTGGGRQKWAIIKSGRGVEYKLSLTATPAPNETTEFASQASFLEKMRTDADIIWTYFTRDPKTHRWTVKRHARRAFFEFMAGWSIYIRDPRRYGWRRNAVTVPEPTIEHVHVPATPEQIEEARIVLRGNDGTCDLFLSRETNAIERGKLSQIAKGFRYRKHGSGRIVHRIPSRKPAAVAGIIRKEVAAGAQVLVWTVFDAESDIIAAELAQGRRKADRPAFELLTGATSATQRLAILERFRTGHCRVLVSRAAVLGFGMNFQHCTAMVFSGWSDSYESYYQAVRRAYRYGQKESVRVYLPAVAELEGDMLENILRKQADHEAAIAEMEANYIRALAALRGEVA